MRTFKIILVSLGILIGLIGLDFAFGYIGVFKTKTVGKARMDAEREVFENSQSYVEGKRQEALKFYKEYKSAEPEEKVAIAQMVSHSFANFDEEKLTEPLRSFVYKCKY